MKNVILAVPAIEKGNRSLAAFGLASQASFTKEVRIHALWQRKWSLILAVELVRLKMKVHLNISDLEGSKIYPNNIILGLEGLRPEVTPIVFYMAGLLKPLDLNLPE